ncbi:MAG: zinc-ribbon domain containing protein [Candidatus Aminicenantia bacterium]
MAKVFVEKIKNYAGIEEVAITGSVASGDKYAQDLDLAIVMRDFSEIDKIAKSARQMSRISHKWEVFVFDTRRNYLGRICVRKECPTLSIDCNVPECGKIPYIRRISNFKFNEEKVFSRKIEILWTKKDSIFFPWQREILKKMNLDKPKEYEQLKDLILICSDCGKEFVWSGSEQKYFKKMGWSPPKRCKGCRPAKCSCCGASLFMTQAEVKDDIILCEACKEILEEE